MRKFDFYIAELWPDDWQEDLSGCIGNRRNVRQRMRIRALKMIMRGRNKK